jgi:hypothetical protein
MNTSNPNIPYYTDTIMTRIGRCNRREGVEAERSDTSRE